MHDLSEEQCTERRELTWLEDHGAAGSERRRDLRGDLVEWPVPRRDQRAHPDGLATDRGCAALRHEGIGPRIVTGDTHMFGGKRHMGRAGVGNCRAHLERESLRKNLCALKQQ